MRLIIFCLSGKALFCLQSGKYFWIQSALKYKISGVVLTEKSSLDSANFILAGCSLLCFFFASMTNFFLRDPDLAWLLKIYDLENRTSFATTSVVHGSQ